MDSTDVADLAKILVALVTVEMLRGTNEARAARGEAMAYPAEAFDAACMLAAQALDRMERRHDND